MSLEQSIDNLAAAIVNLATALTGASVKTDVGTGTKKAAKTETSATTGKPAPAAAEGPAPGPSTATPAAAPEPKAETSAPKEIDFKRDIGPKFLELIEKKGQPAGRAVIDRYDASKSRLSEAITPEQYEDVLAFIEAALAA